MDSDLDGLKDHGKHYPSTGYVDELAWGNIWVYWATGVSSSFIQPCILSLWSKIQECCHLSRSRGTVEGLLRSLSISSYCNRLCRATQR